MSYGVGHRCGLDLALLWPVATAPIQPLAWEPSYATGAALEKAKKKKKTCRYRKYIYISPCIYLLKDIWVVYSLGLLQIK